MEMKYIAIVCAVLLLIFMLYTEYKRPEKHGLVLRLMASVVAIFAFLFLIIPIHYQVAQTVNPDEISFITASTNPDSIPKAGKLSTSDRSILKSLGKKVNF